MTRGKGVLSGKVGMEMCGPNRVSFWPFRYTNDAPVLFENWFRYNVGFCKNA